MLLFKKNDDILSVENEKYISYLKEILRNKTGKGLVNKALQYIPSNKSSKKCQKFQ